MEINNKPQILVVEDEERWHELYDDLLSQKYALTIAKTLQGAEEVLNIVKFDVAIIDLGLDINDSLNTDGIKIIKKINTLDPSIRIIVVTANTDKIQGSDQQILGFIDTIIEKGESLVKDLPNILENAIKVKTAKRKWAYLGDPESRKSGYESFKEVLKSLLVIANADVVHMLIPINQNELEIIVDTGQDEGRIVKISESITGRCYRTKEPINLDDCQSDLEYQAPQNTPKMASELAVPVWQSNEVIGVLNIESKSKNAFNDWHKELMNTFARLAVSILQEDRRQADWKLLNDIAQELLKPTTNLNQTLKYILGQALSLFDAQLAFLGKKEGENLIIEVATSEIINQKALNIENTIIQDALKSELPKRSTLKGIVNQTYLNFGNLSEMVIPFPIDGSAWLLGFGRNNPYMFTPEQENNASFLVKQILFSISAEKQSRRLLELEGQQKQSALAGRLLHKAGNPIFIIRDWVKEINENEFSKLQIEFPNVASIIMRVKKNITYAIEELNQLYDLYMSLRATEVSACIESATHFMFPNCQEKGITLEIQIDSGLAFVQVDDNLGNVIRELIMNSIEAIPHGGIITVGARNHGNDIHVYVSDTGNGISSENLQKIFEPTFTTKSIPTKFDGLGLSWCKKYVEDICKGRLFVEKTEIGVGTTISILLPKAKN